MHVDFAGPCPLLQVFDMDRALAFYCGVLGFEVVESAGKDWALLARRGSEVMLNTMYESDARPAVPDATRAAAHGDTGLYFGCRQLQELYEHLQASGVKANAPRVASYGMEQLYVTDPDGYSLCFQWPASEEMRAAWRKRYGAAV